MQEGDIIIDWDWGTDTYEVSDGRTIEFDWEWYDEPDVGVVGYCICDAINVDTKHPVTDDATLNELACILEQVYG